MVNWKICRLSAHGGLRGFFLLGRMSATTIFTLNLTLSWTLYSFRSFLWELRKIAFIISVTKKSTSGLQNLVCDVLSHYRDCWMINISTGSMLEPFTPSECLLTSCWGLWHYAYWAIALVLTTEVHSQFGRHGLKWERSTASWGVIEGMTQRCGCVVSVTNRTTAVVQIWHPSILVGV